jgi:exopolysaccharide biosynthesis polyprenyl glycosylphosphotransferase
MRPGALIRKAGKMAHIPGSIRRRNIVAGWNRLAPNEIHAKRGGGLWPGHHLPSDPDLAATPLANTPRPKLTGLRIGERKLFQAIGDWLVLAGGLMAIALQSERGYARDELVVSLVVVSGLWFFFANAFDAYSMTVLQSTFRSIYNAATVFVATGITYLLFASFTGGVMPVIRPRISETLIALLILVPLLLVRLLFSLILTHAPLRRHVVVLGANRSGFEMVEALHQYGGATYEFLGYFDDTFAEEEEDANVEPIIEPTSELLRINDLVGIDQIVLANHAQTPSLLHTLSICHERGIQITPMFALYQDLTGRVPVSHLGNDWYVALPAHVKTTTRTYMVMKRVMDLFLASFVLLCVGWVLPLVALVIKLDSPGPIFFKQVRVGRGGKPFKIIKFRSMRQDAEAKTGAVWAQKSDPRITRIGRFLRKSRLDELPQLWNVFVGDMSFVGPRPERPEFEEKLEREIPFYRARRAVQPGLTGWAQVRHGYGNTMLDALRKVEYDLYYIKNESLYLDLLILLRTVAVVLKLAGN